MSRALVCALLLTGCAAQVQAPPLSARSASNDAFAEHALAAAAEGARASSVAAESAHAPGVFRAVQLRVRGLSQRNVSEGVNVGGGVRLLMDRPWTVSTLNDSRAAQVDAASALVKAARARAKALTCSESARGHEDEQSAAYTASYRARIEQLRKWTAAWRDAGTLDPVTAARTELSLARRFVELGAVRESPRKHPNVGVLLELGVNADGVLDQDIERIATRVQAEHPAVAAHIAAARAEDHVSRAEANERLPWLNFVEVGYGASDDGPRDISARLALEVPLDDGARGRKDRALQRSASERLDARSVTLELTERARLALFVLQAFERESEHLQALRDQAEQAEALAARFMSEQRTAPDNVAQLFAEAHASKLAVLDARRRATEAACALEYATGVAPAAWPRVSGERER